MRATYRVLAYVIAVLIAVQAAVIAFALAGVGRWVSEGGVLDKATMENEAEVPFTEVIGFMLHGMTGMMLIPLVALILLVISFFANVPKGAMLAAAIFGLIVVQVLLGSFSRDAGIPFLSLLHGANAFVLFGVVIIAARRARRPESITATAPQTREPDRAVS